MGFICPDCKKDFGTNKEWFEDHRMAHQYLKTPVKKIIVRVEEEKATLKSISNSIKAGRIRVWQSFDGEICFLNTETNNEIRFMPYYDMQGNEVEKEERGY